MTLRKILTEGRVEDSFNKYFGSASQTFKDIFTNEIVPMSATINKNHKYLDWISKNIDVSITNLETGEVEHNLKEIGVALSQFDNKSKRLTRKDINQYRDIEQLHDALHELDGTTRRTVDTSDIDTVEKVYEDDRFVVVVPKTHAASCYYGAGTKWCTASKDTDSHFSTYKRGGELYYIIDKTLPTSSRFYKVALNKKIEGLKEDFWDVKDNMITDTTDILHILQNKKMLEKIRDNFNNKYEERIEEEKVLLAKRLTDQEERTERERIRRAGLRREALERQQNDAWNPEDTDKEGILANALKEYLIDEGEWEGDTKDEILIQIEELRSEMENDPDVIEDPNGDRAQAYGMGLTNLEDDLENAESVYDIIPLNYDHYGLTGFEYRMAEYCIGDDDEADSAAEDNLRSLIDEIGYDGFSPASIELHIDGKEVAEYYEDWFRDEIDESPESYLDEDDREISKEAEDKLDSIDEKIADINNELEETSDETEIEELEDLINYYEVHKEDISEDDDNWEYTEEAKDAYVESRKRDAEYDPVSFLNDYGMTDRLTDFINEDDFIEYVISSDGRGNGISSYDGVENEVVYNDEWYYIYRTN